METTAEQVIRVAIIEDLRDIREGLATMLNFTDGFKCVGRFGSMEEALRSIHRDLPDVVLSDIGLPGMDGIEGVRILREKYPQMTILMLSVYTDNDRIFDALCAGATGYLLKKTPPARIIEALREAVGGGAPMSPEIARKVITLFRDFRPPERVDYDLTPHEQRLLGMMVDGHTKKTAAEEIGVSVNTVSFHLKRVYEKLQVHSKSEAVAKALRNRIFK
ncbi:MAG: response regulator transcription factor [Acidobacteria bacterium]|nr:response regulator transcription factor [Acidobacteriota bacterium]